MSLDTLSLVPGRPLDGHVQDVDRCMIRVQYELGRNLGCHQHRCDNWRHKDIQGNQRMSRQSELNGGRHGTLGSGETLVAEVEAVKYTQDK